VRPEGNRERESAGKYGKHVERKARLALRERKKE